MNEPVSTWASRIMLVGLKTIAQKSTISARSTGLPSISHGTPRRYTCTTWCPIGVCCQEFATTIQMAEKMLPRATMQVLKKCIRGPTRSHPNTRTARNPLSRKKAKTPSAARAEPNTSPTNSLYAAQLVPNSNSMTIPVATPRAKLRAKILVQNFWACRYSGSPVPTNRKPSHISTTPRPMVSGGNR